MFDPKICITSQTRENKCRLNGFRRVKWYGKGFMKRSIGEILLIIYIWISSSELAVMGIRTYVICLIKMSVCVSKAVRL